MKLKNLFSDSTFFTGLFTLAIPITLQNLINSFVNMLDTVMIGQLGTVEIAAVGIGNNFFFLLTMIFFGVASGSSVFTAQYWGKRDIPGIRRNTGISLSIVLIIASLFTIACVFFPAQIVGLYTTDILVITAGATYLKILSLCFIPFSISLIFMLVMRTTEKVKLSMVTTCIALSINLLFNWLLIFGIGPFPQLGVAGAAWATVFARCLETVILLFISYYKKYPMAGTIKELFNFNETHLVKFFTIALPVMVNELFWGLGIALQNIIFARTGTDAIAAFNIVNALSQLTWVVFIGLGMGCSVMIGKKIGEGDESTARDYAARITLFAPMLAIGIGLLLIPLSLLIPLLFNISPLVEMIIRPLIIILALSYPLRAFNMSMVIGVCRAGGDTMFTIFYDLFFMWFFALPCAAAASFLFHLPTHIIYLCLVTEEPLKVIVGAARLKSGKWLHNITH